MEHLQRVWHTMINIYTPMSFACNEVTQIGTVQLEYTLILELVYKI